MKTEMVIRSEIPTLINCEDRTPEDVSYDPSVESEEQESEEQKSEEPVKTKSKAK